ncbi:MAG: Holliday junction branch migration protein RuvA [Prevotella sp.]|nr:Holliday junction branch migration protein RuvA [Prevotella sp.]
MIEYIKGELADITPATAVIEARGVGYLLNISLNTYSAIQGKKEVKLYVHEAIMTGGRDDSYTLYGFYNKQERELYRMLITVSGVGSNTARMILSATSATELVNIIATGNEKALKGVKGIGLKTAQRIIVDLRDKMAASGIIADIASAEGATGGQATLNAQQTETRDEAVGALTMLGFAPAPSNKVVTEILRGNPSMPVEQVIKQALKMIK